MLSPYGQPWHIVLRMDSRIAKAVSQGRNVDSDRTWTGGQIAQRLPLGYSIYNWVQSLSKYFKNRQKGAMLERLLKSLRNVNKLRTVKLSTRDRDLTWAKVVCRTIQEVAGQLKHNILENFTINDQCMSLQSRTQDHGCFNENEESCVTLDRFWNNSGAWISCLNYYPCHWK